MSMHSSLRICVSGASALCRAREGFEDSAPAVTHQLVQPGGVRAVAFQVPMLEVDARPLRLQHREPDLHLGDQRGVVFEARVELPCQHEASRRIPCEDLAPVALAAVFTDLVPPAADPRLDDTGLQWRRADVVLLRPPRAHILREDTERALGRRVDDEGLPNRGIVASIAHESVSFSAAALNAASARSQKRSRYVRMLSMPLGFSR